MFRGVKTESGDIILKATPQLTWLQRLEKWLQKWMQRVLLAALWFGLGLLVGLLVG